MYLFLPWVASKSKMTAGSVLEGKEKDGGVFCIYNIVEHGVCIHITFSNSIWSPFFKEYCFFEANRKTVFLYMGDTKSDHK